MIVTPYLIIVQVTWTNTEDRGALAVYVTPICFTHDSCCLSCQRTLSCSQIYKYAAMLGVAESHAAGCAWGAAF